MTEWTLDKVCEQTMRPSMLNALHACRQGHPFNKGAYRPWYNAFLMAVSHREITAEAIRWLGDKADAETRNLAA